MNVIKGLPYYLIAVGTCAIKRIYNFVVTTKENNHGESQESREKRETAESKVQKDYDSYIHYLPNEL